MNETSQTDLNKLIFRQNSLKFYIDSQSDSNLLL